MAAEYEGFRWIKVPTYVMKEAASWEDRYRELERHHVAETTFLVEKVRELAAERDQRRADVGPPAITSRAVNLPAVIVGVCCILTALFGLCYNASTIVSGLRRDFAPPLKQDDLPYFYYAFYTMSGICVACYVVLLLCGIDLVRSRLRCVPLLTAVFVFEVGYFLAISALWLEPTYGLSIGAATGISSGGLTCQFLILLPLWGPVVLWWTKAQQSSAGTA